METQGGNKSSPFGSTNYLAMTTGAGGSGGGDSILEDGVWDDDFREESASGDKTDPDWSTVINRTFECIYVGNTSIIWTRTCHMERWPSPASPIKASRLNQIPFHNLNWEGGTGFITSP